MDKELYLQDRYLNQEISLLYNQDIIEYDMRDAGLSLIQCYELLPKKKIEKLIELSKKTRPGDPKYGKHQKDIQIGLMQKVDKGFSKNLSLCFAEARRMFIERNNLEINNIISIKKDAFFLIGMVEETKINEYIEFRQKNIYSGYMLIGRIELYYKNGCLDVKVLGEEGITTHENHFLSFILSLFKKLENNSKEDVLKFMRIFLDRYKSYQLDPRYYIEFKPDGMYEYTDGVRTDIHYREDVHEINIRHNYDILIKLIKNIL